MRYLWRRRVNFMQILWNTGVLITLVLLVIYIWFLISALNQFGGLNFDTQYPYLSWHIYLFTYILKFPIKLYITIDSLYISWAFINFDHLINKGICLKNTKQFKNISALQGICNSYASHHLNKPQFLKEVHSSVATQPPLSSTEQLSNKQIGAKHLYSHPSLINGNS